MPFAWNSYHGFYGWFLGHASLTRHWKEMHLHPTCSLLCAAMVLDVYQVSLVAVDQVTFREHTFLRSPVEPSPLPGSSPGDVSATFCWGREGGWRYRAQIVPEKTPLQNSLSQFFALS